MAIRTSKDGMPLLFATTSKKARSRAPHTGPETPGIKRRLWPLARSAKPNRRLGAYPTSTTQMPNDVLTRKLHDGFENEESYEQ